jgi:hypothetical protein
MSNLHLNTPIKAITHLNFKNKKTKKKCTFAGKIPSQFPPFFGLNSNLKFEKKLKKNRQHFSRDFFNETQHQHLVA